MRGKVAPYGDMQNGSYGEKKKAEKVKPCTESCTEMYRKFQGQGWTVEFDWRFTVLWKLQRNKANEPHNESIGRNY